MNEYFDIESGNAHNILSISQVIN